MGTLVAEVAALGLAVAFTSPVSGVTVIVLLSMPSGRRRAIAFVCGWLIAIVAIGAIAIFVLHGQDFSSKHSPPSRAASALEVVVGSMLLLWAVVAYRRRKPSTEAASAPKWLAPGWGAPLFLAAARGGVQLRHRPPRAAARAVLQANPRRPERATPLV